MNADHYERVGRFFWFAIFGIISGLLLIYFLREKPELIPLAFPPLLILLTLELFKGKRRESQHYDYLPNSLFSHITINTVMAGLYIWSLWVVEGYILMKLVLLIVLLAIGTFTTLGYINVQKQISE